MEAALLRLYDSIPAWLVAGVYVLAAVGFMRMYARAQRGAVVIAPPVALAVAGALLVVALFYVLVVPLPLTPLARGGMLRLILLALGVVLVVFNLAALTGANGRRRDD